ncbi:MAG: tetratricopeptide repeat protein, partial [Deltaproteobacteria bacterium]|nr:tetratricopeptide repeat protein [Deltaproteobacteria bacterium]
SNIIASMSRMGNNQGAIEKAETLLRKAPPEAKKNAYPLFLLHLGNIYLAEKEYQQAYECYVKGFRFVTAYNMPFEKSFADNMVCALQTGLQAGFSFQGELEGIKNAQSAAYEKMAEICFDLRNDKQALYYCQGATTDEILTTKCRVIRSKINQFKVADRLQRQKGTIRTKYFFHPVASSFNFYMATAYLLIKAGFPNDSLTWYFLQKAKNNQPENIDVRLLSSWLYYKRRSYQAAIREIDKAIALDKEYAQLWINRGIYCLAAGKNDEAMVAFRKVLDLYPDYPHQKKLAAMMLAAGKNNYGKTLSHES